VQDGVSGSIGKMASQEFIVFTMFKMLTAVLGALGE
jgi:hypothetical protein